MLTEADYEAGVATFKAIEAINALLAPLVNPKAKSRPVIMNVGADKFSIRRPDEEN